jgi:hypothetical protein
MERSNSREQDHAILIFEDRRRAVEAVRSLLDGGVARERISFFMQANPDPGILDTEIQQATEHDGILGAELGALAGLGLFAIPGVGPVLGTGTVATALTGAILGSSVGGVAGALAGAGLSKANAAFAEHQLREGKAIVVVEHGDDKSKLPAIASSPGLIEIACA